MSRVYLSDEEVGEMQQKPQDFREKIVIREKMTLQDLIDLQERTGHRFSFEATDIPNTYRCRWREYHRTDSGKYVMDGGTGALLLEDLQEKLVVVEWWIVVIYSA